jgi:DNA-binding protein H-NS
LRYCSIEPIEGASLSEGDQTLKVDLNSLSLKELKDLQSQVAKAISGYEDRRKKELLAELDEIAKAKGFSLAELTGSAPSRKRSPSVAKYANPANAADTWSGRGRKPRWFSEALAKGKKPEDMAI